LLEPRLKPAINPVQAIQSIEQLDAGFPELIRFWWRLICDSNSKPDSIHDNP